MLALRTYRPASPFVHRQCAVICPHCHRPRASTDLLREIHEEQARRDAEWLREELERERLEARFREALLRGESVENAPRAIFPFAFIATAPVQPTSTTYSTAGSRNYTVPNYNNIQFTVLGGGGGGGSSFAQTSSCCINSYSSGSAGTGGGSSTAATSTTIVAQGGGGGGACTYALVCSGCSSTNTFTNGATGARANGNSGPSGIVIQNQQGAAGGTGGSKTYTGTCGSTTYKGGDGAPGAKVFWSVNIGTAGAPNPGDVIACVVGNRGTGGTKTNATSGANGGVGSIIIVTS